MNISNIPVEILDDHMKFLLLMADIVGHSISNIGWIRVRASLSPATRFILTDPIMMAPEVFTKTKFILTNKIIYKERGVIKLYFKYMFSDYEAAACYDFLLWGAQLNKLQSLDIDGVSHMLTLDIDNPLKIISIVTVEKTKAADIYNRLLGILNTNPKI